MDKKDWTRGYLCAIAKVIESAGVVTPEVEMLFHAGGDWRDADPLDIDVFVAHGLVKARRPRRLTPRPPDSPPWRDRGQRE